MCEICDAYTKLHDRYEQAVAAKIAAGPEHENDPDCDCDICDEERELYFIESHFFDGQRPYCWPQSQTRSEDTSAGVLTADDIPF